MISNPFQAWSKKLLTDAVRAVTLEGGAGGHDDTTPEALAASSAEEEYDLGVMLATSLDVLLDIFKAANEGDRKAFEEAFHELTSVLELWNDAKPKA